MFQMPCCKARIHCTCMEAWTQKGGNCPICDTPFLGKLSSYEFAAFDEFERHRYELCKLLRLVLRSKRRLSVILTGFRKIRFSRNKTHISLIYKKREYHMKYSVVDVYRARTCNCIDPPLQYVVFIEFDTAHNICLEVKQMHVLNS